MAMTDPNYISLTSRAYPVQDMAPTPKEASPLDRLLRAISRLEEATCLVAHMTDSLCGSAVQTEAKSYPPSDPAPAGHFAAISVSATRIDRMADAIIECMNRIQRVAG